MRKSNEVNEIASALSRAQLEFEAVSKSSKGYGYKYASLDELIEKTKKGLANNGLSHTIVMDDENGLELECILMHQSGQWISSKMKLKIDGKKNMSPMQQLGSSITYGRRYLLQSLIGVASEEDTDDALAPRTVVPQVQKKPINAPTDIVHSIKKAMVALTNDYADIKEVERLEDIIGVKSHDQLLALTLEQKQEALSKLRTEWAKLNKSK